MIKAALLLSACTACTAPDLTGPGANPFAPQGSPRGEEGVDGLIVGHRLMAAHEYELALKSYLRSAGQHGLNVDVLSALGSVNIHLGRLGQAEKLLRQAIDKDETFVPAWNNLGVVLMETRQYGEAARVFQVAFGLDNGNSEQIRDNLRLALAKIENPEYIEDDNYNFALVRRGAGDFQLLSSI